MHFRQRQCRGCDGNGALHRAAGEFARELILGKVDRAGGRRQAIAARDDRCGLDAVVVDQRPTGYAGEGNSRNASRRQRGQFARVGDAVLIQVTPKPQVGVARVGAVEDTVSVRVQIAQRIEAVGGELAIALDCVYAKQFTPRFDDAVAIAVPHQKCVVSPGPTRAGADAVGVVVEQHHTVGCAQLESIAVEVDHQGIAARGEVASTAKVVTNRHRDVGCVIVGYQRRVVDQAAGARAAARAWVWVATAADCAAAPSPSATTSAAARSWYGTLDLQRDAQVAVLPVCDRDDVGQSYGGATASVDLQAGLQDTAARGNVLVGEVASLK